MKGSTTEGNAGAVGAGGQLPSSGFCLLHGIHGCFARCCFLGEEKGRGFVPFSLVGNGRIGGGSGKFDLSGGGHLLSGWVVKGVGAIDRAGGVFGFAFL